MTKKSKIIFQKIGMTQLFDKQNNLYAITVLKLEKTSVVAYKTQEVDGYEAVILTRGDKLNKHKLKPHMGKDKKYLKTLGALYESPMSDLLKEEEITVERFVSNCPNLTVDVTALTKGKGFSGVMKRHNFKGLGASHGVSACHRSGGSTGMRTEPGRTMKNQKMAGHYGHEKVTIKNLKVFGIDKANQCLFLVGAVPGPNKSYVSVVPISLRMQKGDVPMAAKIQKGELYVAN
jgi:large subunit ribosomal protein L3